MSSKHNCRMVLSQEATITEQSGRNFVDGVSVHAAEDVIKKHDISS